MYGSMPLAASSVLGLPIGKVVKASSIGLIRSESAALRYVVSGNEHRVAIYGELAVISSPESFAAHHDPRIFIG
jgi:hypothetical protein